MPEGDTIFRTAVRLRPVLVGRRIASADAGRHPDVDVEPLGGQVVSCIEARGKHLLIHVEHGLAIHSHMGMTGSWHCYREHEAWQKPRHRAALVLTMQVFPQQDNGAPVDSIGHGDPCTVAVCFSPKLLEVLSPIQLRRHRWLTHLGPDLLGADWSIDEAIRRLRWHEASSMGEAIMNQSIVCGIGNIYKSETLFVTRSNPFLEVAGYDDTQLREIVSSARYLMLRNTGGHPRRTRTAGTGPKMWVYGRSGQPCLVCGQAIQMRHQGDLGRSTYFCPACQMVNDHP
ncbi:MAG: hypothetical protein KDA99_28010 [Planctomycetales bacterium]|nr:hypothetical protein [Planctomycetales bacterium]